MLSTQTKNMGNGSRWEAWLRSYGLRSRNEMPSFLCPNKHIMHGYRQSPSSWTYCFKSLFNPTNETLNVWTHAISLLFMVNHYWNFIGLYPDYVANPIFYPYWIFLAGTVTVLAVSSLTHLFNCKSPAMYDACFCYDHAGISFYGIGITVSLGIYICPYSCVGLGLDTSMWVFASTLAACPVAVVCTCLTRYPSVTHKYLLRVVINGLIVLVFNLPCFYKFILKPDVDVSIQCRTDNNFTQLVYFAITAVCWILSALLQSTHFPESYYPGKFDIVGHSHQLFHLSFSVTVYFQSLLIEGTLTTWIEMLQAESINPETLQITWFNVVIVPMVSCLLSAAAAVRYSLDLYKLRSHSKID